MGYGRPSWLPVGNASEHGLSAGTDRRRGSRMDDSEGEVDARRERPGGFRELMLPIVLGGAAHEQEAAVRKLHRRAEGRV